MSSVTEELLTELADFIEHGGGGGGASEPPTRTILLRGPTTAGVPIAIQMPFRCKIVRFLTDVQNCVLSSVNRTYASYGAGIHAGGSVLCFNGSLNSTLAYEMSVQHEAGDIVYFDSFSNLATTNFVELWVEPN